jgi:hypothetical protein
MNLPEDTIYAFRSDAGDGWLYNTSKYTETKPGHASKFEPTGPSTWQLLVNPGDGRCLEREGVHVREGPVCSGSGRSWDVIWHPAWGTYTIEVEAGNTASCKGGAKQELTAYGPDRDAEMACPLTGPARFRQQWQL